MIRVKATVPWPDHGESSPNTTYSADRLREKGITGEPSDTYPVVFTLGSPAAPSRIWTCGTDIVWPVLEINGRAIEAVNGTRPYVCRHEIEAGD
jgi:hypothetical protein